MSFLSGQLRRGLGGFATTWLGRLIPLGADRESTNIRLVLIDGLGVGLGLAAQPYVPVLLARLGADNFAIGLLAALPALSRLLFGIVVGRFLSTRRNIIPWFSSARFVVLTSFGIIGFVPLLVSHSPVPAILGVAAMITVPQSIVAVCFTVIMATVAGTRGRYYLMSRRWAVIGLTTAGGVALGSVLLARINFPINYTVFFVLMAVGGLISFTFSRRIDLPDSFHSRAASTSARNQEAAFWVHLKGHPGFLRFTICHFLYRFGLAGLGPLLPLYYLRNMKATDSEIGLIVMIGSATPVLAYFGWEHLSRKRSGKVMLLWTTLGVALQPLLLPLGGAMLWAMAWAVIAATFQAGFDLAIFDALAANLPQTRAPFFAGIYQTTLNLAMFTGPLALTALSEVIGIWGALWTSGAICLVGFLAFYQFYHHPPPQPLAIRE